MDPNEKIQLDDITFDDVIGGAGVSTTAETLPTEDLEPQPQPELEDLDEVDDKIEDEIEEKESEEQVDDRDENFAQDEDEEEEYEEEEYEDENDDVQDDDSVISEVIDKLGYDIENPTYEDTSEGIAQLTTDLASQIADDRIDEVMESFPLVKEHLDYVLAGGDSKNFMKAYDPAGDYSSLNLEQDDVKLQKQVVANYFQAKGHEQEFIKEMVNDFEDSGKLFEKSQQAKTALANVQEQQRTQLVEEQRRNQAHREQKMTDFWNGVADTIEDSKEFAGINVPDREKDKFFQYLSSPVTREGYTQRDIDHRDADMDIKLAIDYLMYKGFDLGSLVDSKAKTQRARSLKDRISRNEDSVKSAKRSSRRKGGDIDLDSLDLAI